MGQIIHAGLKNCSLSFFDYERKTAGIFLFNPKLEQAAVQFL